MSIVEIEKFRNSKQVISIYFYKYVLQNNSVEYIVKIEYIDKFEKKDYRQFNIEEVVYLSYDIEEKCTKDISGVKCICSKQIK